MTTTTAAEIQNEQLSDFVIEPHRGGPTTLVKDATTFTVGRDSNVELNDAGNGVQVKRPDAAASAKPSPDIHYEDPDTQQVITTLGATVTAPKDGPAAVTTAGDVFLVDPNFPEAPALAEGAAPKTGLKLNLADEGITGEIDGTRFDINDKNVAIDAKRIKVTPADEATTDEETDVEVSLSRNLNVLVVKGPNVDVRVEIDDDKHSRIYVKGGYKIKSAASANTGVNGAAIETTGDVTRFTLAGGKVYDINLATGKLTAYTAPDDEVVDGGDPELADLGPHNGAYKIAISQDGKRVALNGSSIEKTEDGFVSSTDGVSQVKPFAALAALAATAKAEKEAKAEKAYSGAWIDTGIPSPTYPGTKILVAAEDIPGVQTKDKAVQVANDAEAVLPDTHEIDALTTAFNGVSPPPCQPLDGKNPDQYWTSDERVGRVHVAFRPRKRAIIEGNKPSERHTRLIKRVSINNKSV